MQGLPIQNVWTHFSLILFFKKLLKKSNSLVIGSRKASAAGLLAVEDTMEHNESSPSSSLSMSSEALLEQTFLD